MTTYHHGDLPAALRAASVELIAEKGTSGFSLRQVARQAGVSHAAPAHHFGDVEGLLTAVAIEGFSRLADEMSEAAAGIDDPVTRLREAGRAYVRVALENPGHFAVMLQDDLCDRSNPDLLTASARSYDVLLECIRAIRDDLNSALDVDRAATFAWSSVQGLVTLAPKLADVSDEMGTEFTEAFDLVDAFCHFMVNGFASR